MRLMALVLAAGLLLPVPVSSQTGTVPALFSTSGNELFRSCTDGFATSRSLCNGYVAGVADTIEAMNSWGVTTTVCLQEHVSNEQIKDIVTQYLTAHPETRHLGAAGLVVHALHNAFPCKEQAH